MATKTPNFPYRKIQLRDIQGIAAGNTAIINCPKGPRYKYIGLVIGNTAAGNGNAPTPASIISNIKCVLGTGVQRDVSASALDLINKAMGSEADYGAQAVVTGGANGTGRTILPLYFEEPWRKRTLDQNGLAWQTGWLGKNDVFQIRVALAAGITPSLQAFAMVDDFDGGAPNPIMKWFSEQSNTNAATNEVSNFTQGAPGDDMLSQISLLDTSDGQAVTQVRLQLNKELIYDDVTAQELQAVLVNYGMKPVLLGGAYHIVFDHDDMLTSLRRVGDIASSSIFQTFAAASAGTQTRVVQRLGLPE